MARIAVTETVKNGVKVRVERHLDVEGESIGSVVLADCQCFGNPKRLHSTEYCPLYQTQKVS